METEMFGTWQDTLSSLFCTVSGCQTCVLSLQHGITTSYGHNVSSSITFLLPPFKADFPSFKVSQNLLSPATAPRFVPLHSQPGTSYSFHKAI